MINAKDYKPRIFPIKRNCASAEIDRAQNIAPTATLNREKVQEIGREGAVGYIKKSPTVTYRLTQYEYGSLEFFQKIINNDGKGGIGKDAITIDDFKTSYFDIVGYLTDNDGTFVGTIHYPTLRCSGFSINAGEPQGIIERTFDLIGESALIWKGNNKYFIYQEESIAAVADPTEAGKYMIRVVRVDASGNTTILSKVDGDYTEISTKVTVAVVSTGDLIKLYYTSSSAPDVMFTPNNADPEAITGESVSIYLYIPASGKPGSSDYIHRLQSATIGVAFDREDLRELGNKEVVQRGIANTTVTVTLGRILEDFTIEEILSGEAPGFGKIDISQLTDRATLIIKFYSDNTKSEFVYGIKIEGLSPTDLGNPVAVDEHVGGDNTMEAESLIITADTSILGI
jgi:hypothetical protein